MPSSGFAGNLTSVGLASDSSVFLRKPYLCLLQCRLRAFSLQAGLRNVVLAGWEFQGCILTPLGVSA